MIFKIKSILLAIFLGGITQLWGTTCPLSLSNSSIDPAPMSYLGDANGSFNISTGERLVPLDNGEGGINCTIEVVLNKTELKEHDINLILGTVNTYFTVNYNLANNKLTFTQKIDIPGNTEIHLTIPLDVTGQSSADTALNGFIANITTNASTVSEYTYTDSAVLIANDVNATVDSVTENIAIGNITVNDTINGKPVTLGGDINITAISNTTVLIINQNTGSVTVPADTPKGLYIVEYTICEIYNTNNCSTGNIDINVTENNIPDYELVLDVTPSVITEGSSAISILLQVTEYDHGANSGDLIIFLSKDVTTNINFDSTLTTLGGRTLSNSEWEYKKTAVGHQFKYIGNEGEFPSYSRFYIGLEGIFNSPENTVGKLPVNVQILEGSGDTNSLNDEDSDTISHSYIIN